MVEQFLAREVEEAEAALALAQKDFHRAAQEGTHGEFAFARDALDVALSHLRQSIVAQANHAFAKANPDLPNTEERDFVAEATTPEEYREGAGIETTGGYGSDEPDAQAITDAADAVQRAGRKNDDDASRRRLERMTEIAEGGDDD